LDGGTDLYRANDRTNADHPISMRPIFISGIGTGIGKTVVAAIVAQSLGAAYWKPVQAGYEDGTDMERVRIWTDAASVVIYPELYRLAMPASPHIAARNEGTTIRIAEIVAQYHRFSTGRPVVIEGAGGLMVPLNDEGEWVAGIAKELNAHVILVSRNYLGSINHSMLTAAYCRQQALDVAGWIFNDQYLDYENEIAAWSGYQRLGSIPPAPVINGDFVAAQARDLFSSLKKIYEQEGA
jgi:dethiobiotin synthetase